VVDGFFSEDVDSDLEDSDFEESELDEPEDSVLADEDSFEDSAAYSRARRLVP
jgi:hypothetical protein